MSEEPVKIKCSCSFAFQVVFNGCGTVRCPKCFQLLDPTGNIIKQPIPNEEWINFDPTKEL